jgi:hypothetical protein
MRLFSIPRLTSPAFWTWHKPCDNVSVCAYLQLDVQSDVRPMLDQAAASLHLLAAAETLRRKEIDCGATTAATVDEVRAALSTEGGHVATASWLLGDTDAAPLVRAVTHRCVPVSTAETLLMPHSSPVAETARTLCSAAQRLWFNTATQWVSAVNSARRRVLAEAAAARAAKLEVAARGAGTQPRIWANPVVVVPPLHLTDASAAAEIDQPSCPCVCCSAGASVDISTFRDNGAPGTARTGLAAAPRGRFILDCGSTAPAAPPPTTDAPSSSPSPPLDPASMVDGGGLPDLLHHLVQDAMHAAALTRARAAIAARSRCQAAAADEQQGAAAWAAEAEAHDRVRALCDDDGGLLTGLRAAASRYWQELRGRSGEQLPPTHPAAGARTSSPSPSSAAAAAAAAAASRPAAAFAAATYSLQGLAAASAAQGGRSPVLVYADDAGHVSALVWHASCADSAPLRYDLLRLLHDVLDADVPAPPPHVAELLPLIDASDCFPPLIGSSGIGATALTAAVSRMLQQVARAAGFIEAPPTQPPAAAQPHFQCAWLLSPPAESPSPAAAETEAGACAGVPTSVLPLVRSLLSSRSVAVPAQAWAGLCGRLLDARRVAPLLGCSADDYGSAVAAALVRWSRCCPGLGLQPPAPAPLRAVSPPPASVSVIPGGGRSPDEGIVRAAVQAAELVLAMQVGSVTVVSLRMHSSPILRARKYSIQPVFSELCSPIDLPASPSLLLLAGRVVGCCSH